MSKEILNTDVLNDFDPTSSGAVKTWYTMLASAIAIFVGVDENVILGLVMGAPLLFEAIMELIKKTKKPTYTGNFIVYLFGGLALAIPGFSGIIEALEPIADVFANGGSWTAIVPFLLGLFNQVIVWIKTRNNKSDLSPAA